MASVHDLARKHRVPPEALPALAQQLRTELDDIENYDTNLGKLADEVKAARAGYLKIAQELSRDGNRRPASSAKA